MPAKKIEPEDAPVPEAPPAYADLTLLDMLSRAQRGLYATLLHRIESGSADKDDIRTLRQLLAENGMTLQVDAIERRMIDVTPKPMELPDFTQGKYDE